MAPLGAVLALGALFRKVANRSGWAVAMAWAVAAAVGRENEPPRPLPEMSAPASSRAVCAAQYRSSVQAKTSRSRPLRALPLSRFRAERKALQSAADALGAFCLGHAARKRAREATGDHCADVA